MRTWILVLTLFAAVTPARAQASHPTYPSPRFPGGRIEKAGGPGPGGTLWREYDASGTLRGRFKTDSKPAEETLTVYDDKGREVYEQYRRLEKGKTETRTKWRKYDAQGRLSEQGETRETDDGAGGNGRMNGERVTYDYVSPSDGLGTRRTEKVGTGWRDEAGKPVNWGPPQVDKGLQYAPYETDRQPEKPATPGPSVGVTQTGATSQMSPFGTHFVDYGYIDTYGSVPMPAGDFKEEVAPGKGVGVGLSYQLKFNDKFSLGQRLYVEMATFGNADGMPDDYSAKRTVFGIDAIHSFGDNDWMPFIEAGVGLSRNTFDYGGSSVSEWKPGFRAGAGLDYRISEKYNLGVGVRFENFGTFDTRSIRMALKYGIF